MYGINPFLLLLLPFVFQLVFGIKKFAQIAKLNFTKVAFINIFLQILFSYFVFNIISNRLNANGPLRCGMPFVGLIFAELLLFGVLLLTILIQYLIKRYYRSKTE